MKVIYDHRLCIRLHVVDHVAPSLLGLFTFIRFFFFLADILMAHQRWPCVYFYGHDLSNEAVILLETVILQCPSRQPASSFRRPVMFSVRTTNTLEVWDGDMSPGRALLLFQCPVPNCIDRDCFGIGQDAGTMDVTFLPWRFRALISGDRFTPRSWHCYHIDDHAASPVAKGGHLVILSRMR